jgi:MFS family permease
MSTPAKPAPSPERQELPHNVKVLGGASLANDIASEMIYPLLPLFLITRLGGNKFTLGVIEGFVESASSLLKLWAGGRSDRAGKRKAFVVFGYSPSAVARPLLGLVVAPWQLFAARLADRIGKGVRTAPRDALIADSTPQTLRGRAFGFHRAMDHLGAAIGPLVATLFLRLWPDDLYFLDLDELRVLFLLTLIPGAGVVLLLVLGLRETTGATASKETFRLTLGPFGRNFRWYLLALVIFTLGNSSDAFLLIRAGELGVPVVLLPTLWFVFHVAKSAGNLYLGRLADVISPRLMILAGWGCYAVVYLGFALITESWQVWAFFLGYALFSSLTEPAEKALVANLAGPEHRGLAFGWYNFAIGIAALPSSLLFGLIYELLGPLAAFGWGAGLAAVAALLLLAVRQEK